MLLLTVVLQLILADLTRSNVDRVLEDRADAVASSAISASKAQDLVVPSADLDPGIVVYDGAGRRVVGVAARHLQATFDKLSTSTSTQFVTAGSAERIIAIPFTTTGGSQGVVVVSERLEPYEEAERYALIVSLITGALATAAAAGIAASVTTRALKPVALLAQTATDWSEHDLSRRFELGSPTNEITALAATLDTLLDKVTAAIRSEQRLTSELAHELRTPLTVVQGTADLALMQDELSPPMREVLEEISEASRRMATTITTLLDVARTESSLMDAASCSIADVVRDVLATLPHDGLTVHVDLVDHRVAAPATIAARALAPVVANALRFARDQVVITAVAGSAGALDVVVEDDGPGVEGDPERIFEPGVTSSGGSGAGLGLTIARRMARSVGGDLEVAHARTPTRLVLRLPLA
ncbi:HAMP domain-containing sensor histidine kinase [Nocardioides sp.]|uniref:sensor histidine kinase n=1 Tax=Nocardioides sp. TaxID=35761 RepID=UPI00286DEEC0|nr:HAMP domain-containing sensor histidine kinase [Nocardioides sp.]